MIIVMIKQSKGTLVPLCYFRKQLPLVKYVAFFGQSNNL